MGGVIPTQHSNDELVDNLIEEQFIKSKNIENVFRAVDRGYFFPGFIEDAYGDFANRSDNLHISATCIYCELLENLELKEGHSFLNIGSGTGYLSTMAGFIIGTRGCNIGIDIYEDVIRYGKEKVNDFILYSKSFDGAHFCIPSIVLANALNLNSDARKFDRIYCGACIPNENILKQLKMLLKNNGIFIYPYQDYLMKSTLNDGVWTDTSLLQVQFCNLIEPTDGESVILYSQPQSLQEISRLAVLCSVKDLSGLDSLPLPSILIKYLKYFRDPSPRFPESKLKSRQKET